MSTVECLAVRMLFTLNLESVTAVQNKRRSTGGKSKGSIIHSKGSIDGFSLASQDFIKVQGNLIYEKAHFLRSVREVASAEKELRRKRTGSKIGLIVTAVLRLHFHRTPRCDIPMSIRSRCLGYFEVVFVPNAHGSVETVCSHGGRCFETKDVPMFSVLEIFRSLFANKPQESAGRANGLFCFAEIIPFQLFRFPWDARHFSSAQLCSESTAGYASEQ